MLTGPSPAARRIARGGARGKSGTRVDAARNAIGSYQPPRNPGNLGRPAPVIAPEVVVSFLDDREKADLLQALDAYAEELLLRPMEDQHARIWVLIWLLRMELRAQVWAGQTVTAPPQESP